MIVTTEKREVLGTLKTLLGTYSLLGDAARKVDECWRFNVVDDEGFQGFIQVHGDFIILPSQIPTVVDVKRVLTESEAQEANKSELVSVETID